MRGHLRFRDGAWRLTVHAGVDPATGKRRQIHRTVRAPQGRDGRRQAEKALAELVLEVEARRGAPVGDRSTLGEFLEGYITRRSAGWAPSTQVTDPGLIRRHIIPHLGDRRLGEVRRRDVAELHGTLAAAGLAPGSVKKVHGILHRALADAVRLELIPHNPATGVSPPKVPKGKPDAPSDDEIDRILAAVDDPGFLTLLRLDAILGARRGEIAALRWSDIDFAAGTITVARAISKGPGGQLVERQTKTGAVTPIALDDGTVAELRAHRKRRLEQAMACGVRMDETGFVFVLAEHPVGDRPMGPDSITYRMTKARKAARPKVTGVTFHDVRHYVASMLLAGGVDVRTVAHRLGHASPNQTLATYAHLIPAADRAAAEVLAQRRRRPS